MCSFSFFGGLKLTILFTFKLSYFSVWLHIHVFSSILALAAGFTQFSSEILKNHRQTHRIIGRIYAFTIIVVNFPAAMIMAIYANGLLPSKIAFTILDCLWFYFTLRAVLAARRHKIGEYRRFMIRSYALTFSAITLRTWKIILGHLFHPDTLTLYMIDAWMGFVPNLLFAEWLIRRSSMKPHISDRNPEKYT